MFLARAKIVKASYFEGGSDVRDNQMELPNYGSRVVEVGWGARRPTQRTECKTTEG